MKILAFLSRAKIKALAPAFLLGVYMFAVTLGLVNGGVWATLGIAGAILLALMLWAADKKFPWPDQKIAILTLLFLGLSVALAFFSSFQEKALSTTFKMASIFLPLLLLSSPRLLALGQRLRTEAVDLAELLTFGFVFLSLALVTFSFLVGFESSPITKLNRGFSYGLLLAAPLLAWAMQHSKEQGYALLAALVLATLLTHSRVAQAGVIVALGVFVVARFWPVLVTWLLGFGMILSLLWPFAARWSFLHTHDFVTSKLPASWGARMEIWDYMAYRIAEKPILGWGLGTSDQLVWDKPHGDFYHYLIIPAAHPHNAVIQLWAEMGLIGLAFGALACFWLLRSASKLEESFRPFALAALAGGCVLLLAAYNLWTDSLWAAFALTVYLFASLGKIKPSLSAKLQDEGQ